MKKKLYYTLYIMLLIAISLTIFTPYVHAGIIDNGRAFLESGKSGGVYDRTSGTINDVVRELSGTLYALGVLIAIIATIVLGIKYMTASSSDNKSAVKKSAIIVGVGVFVLFASGLIWQIVVSSLSKVT